MRYLLTSAIAACALAGCSATQVNESAGNAAAPAPGGLSPNLAPTGEILDGKAAALAARQGREGEEEHNSDDLGPPPYGYWKITGDPVPDWKPADQDDLRDGPRSPLQWYPLGPRPIVSEYWSGNDDASGRVVSIAPHPDDADTCYLASASGGVWKTVDGGATWTPITDELSTLNHGVVALDPNDHDTVYVGTGEYTTGSTGDGIFRSENGGDTWERLADASIVGSQFSGIAVDPTDSDIIHITTRSGYYRSDDQGATWTRYKAGACSSLALNPDDPQIVYVGRHDDGVYRSLDGGNTLTRLSGGLPSSGDVDRALVTVSAANPDVLYASFSLGSGVEGTYRSEDGGTSWTLLNHTPNFAYPQAWYDMYIVADPDDENTVYAGGVDSRYAQAGIIKSTDGGDSWDEIGQGVDGGWTHPDHHAIAFGPGGIIWEGNDGGIWKSTDGGDHWINCNATLTVTQNYAIGENALDNAQILGGTQDNGSIERQDDTLAWPQVVGGDGGFCAYDFNNPNIKYTEYVYLDLQRWINGSYSDITGPWNSDPRNFIAPFIMDPNNSTTLVAGTNRVWRTLNASTGADWNAISSSVVGGGGTLNALAVAVGASDTIYSGSSTGSVFVTQNASDWADRSGGLPNGKVTDIVIDPADPAHAYVTFRNTSGGRIFETTNYGVNWDDRTGDLPDGAGVTALDIAWHRDPVALFIGTGAGVWSSFDNGDSWIKDEYDLPNVNIGDLKVDPINDTITAGTYGRGTWRANLSDTQLAFTIVLPDGAPDLLAPGVATEFPVRITPIQENILGGSETLFYDYGGGFLSVPLQYVSDDDYIATLPAAFCSDSPRFYLQAQGDQGTIVTNPAGAPIDAHEALVGELLLIAEDDMEQDGDWTVGVPDDDASTGIWERVDPVGTLAQPENDHTPSPGTDCWITDGRGGGIGDWDIDGGKTTLISPTFNLVGLTEPMVSYWLWYLNDGNSSVDDIFVVQISNDNGVTWTEAEVVGPTGAYASGGWYLHQFRVSEFVTPTNAVKLAFIASDEGSGSIVEAAIDDLRIEGVSCGDQGCAGDIDGDGDTDQSDLGILLASYEINGDGDLNGDGETNQQDLGILLADYNCTAP